MFVNHLYAIIKYVSDAKKIVSEIGIKMELGPILTSLLNP